MLFSYPSFAVSSEGTLLYRNKIKRSKFHLPSSLVYFLSSQLNYPLFWVCGLSLLVSFFWHPLGLGSYPLCVTSWVSHHILERCKTIGIQGWAIKGHQSQMEVSMIRSFDNYPKRLYGRKSVKKNTWITGAHMSSVFNLNWLAVGCDAHGPFIAAWNSHFSCYPRITVPSHHSWIIITDYSILFQTFFPSFHFPSVRANSSHCAMKWKMLHP